MAANQELPNAVNSCAQSCSLFVPVRSTEFYGIRGRFIFDAGGRASANDEGSQGCGSHPFGIRAIEEALPGGGFALGAVQTDTQSRKDACRER